MSTIKNVAFVLGSSVFAKGIGFLQAFLLARVLGPADFGVWITLLIVVAYSPIICLGTVESLLKEVPYYLGRNELDRVHEIENAVLGSLVLAGAVLVGMGLAGCMLLPRDFLGAGPFLILVVLITIAISFFSAYFQRRFTAYENFKLLGVLDACRSLIAICFIGGLGWAWGIRGAVFGYLLQEAIICAITVWFNMRDHGAVEVSFRKDLLLHAIQVGFPITILWWVLTLQATVDRVVLKGLVDHAAVGYYGLGISVTNALAMLPTVVATVLYPKVNRQVGTGVGAEGVKPLVLGPTLTVGLLLMNLQMAALAGMPILYRVMLPRYQPGLLAGEILVTGVFFVCLLRNGANYMIAHHMERAFLKYIFVALVFNVVVDISFVRLGWGLEGVAIGTSLAGLLLNTFVWRSVFSGLGFGRYEVWTRIGYLYVPGAVLVMVALCIRMARPTVLERFDPVSVVIWAGLILLANGMLCFFPLYRAEMAGWRKAFFRIKEAVWPRLGIADPA